MRCIFCLEERPSSKEHVFPDAIGGTLTIERVCKPCNDWLGANVDSLLTDHGLILLKRAQLGTRDSAGRPLDPFLSLFRRGTMADDPTQKVELRADPATDELVPYLFHKSTIEQREDGKKIIHTTIDASDAGAIGKIIQRTRRREGLLPLPDAELEAAISQAKAGVRSKQHPEIKFNFDGDLRDYKRAVCKIAYELAWLWLGDEYLDDPVAVKLRDAILKGDGEDIRGRIELDANQMPLVLWKGEGSAHIALAISVGPHLSVSLRIFDSISGAIVVSESADKYRQAGRPIEEGLFVVNDPQTGRLHKGTMMDELMRMTRGAARL